MGLVGIDQFGGKTMRESGEYRYAPTPPHCRVGRLSDEGGLTNFGKGTILIAAYAGFEGRPISGCSPNCNAQDRR
jgi:hypothetical protein